MLRSQAADRWSSARRRAADTRAPAQADCREWRTRWRQTQTGSWPPPPTWNPHCSIRRTPTAHSPPTVRHPPVSLRSHDGRAPANSCPESDTGCRTPTASLLHQLLSTPTDTTHTHTRRRGSVVRTSVFRWQTFPDWCLIYGWHVTASSVKRPLWVNQPGQLSLPSIWGRPMDSMSINEYSLLLM